MGQDPVERVRSLDLNVIGADLQRAASIALDKFPDAFAVVLLQAARIGQEFGLRLGIFEPNQSSKGKFDFVGIEDMKENQVVFEVVEKMKPSQDFFRLVDQIGNDDDHAPALNAFGDARQRGFETGVVSDLRFRQRTGDEIGRASCRERV